jgi:UDP-glucose 4-epimerase
MQTVWSTEDGIQPREAAVRVLVTGGRGFIGSHVTAAAEARGWEARSYDLADGQDVGDADAVGEAVVHCDAVIHCAGLLGSAETMEYPKRVVDANLHGILNVLDACQAHGVPLVNMCVKRSNWMNPYLITKRCAGEFVEMYRQFRGVLATNVRTLNVYGPGQHWGRIKKAVPTMIMAALRGEPVTVYGDGSQITDQIHVSDVAEILLRVISYEAWNVDIEAGTGRPMTVAELAGKIIALCGMRSGLVIEPMRPGEPMSDGWIADATALVRLLNYYPRVRLDDGLAQTVAWYREHGTEVEDRG